MRKLIHSLVIVALVLVVPFLPFLLLDTPIHRWVAQWDSQSPSPTAVTSLVIGLLASDIFLPVPSSLLVTLAGVRLGAWLGTLAAWLGLTVGAALGFALARRWGRPFAIRLTDERSLAEMQQLSDRFGPAVLVVTRSLPLLAEASVLLMGIHQLSWHRFLLPVALANLGISLAYCHFGTLAQRYELLPAACAISLGLPLLLALFMRKWLVRMS